VLQVESDVAIDLPTLPIGGGFPSTYSELTAMSMHSHMSHVANIIVQGMFVRYPSLRVLLVGGGLTWIPGWLWRLDALYKDVSLEAPWLQKLPSDYFREHVRLATSSIEPSLTDAQRDVYLRLLPDVQSSLLFATGDAGANGAPTWLPTEWYENVLRDNALNFFRWRV
jgi:predicted TIM-barrel fold metal-dependent hydrolase